MPIEINDPGMARIVSSDQTIEEVGQRLRRRGRTCRRPLMVERGRIPSFQQHRPEPQDDVRAGEGRKGRPGEHQLRQPATCRAGWWRASTGPGG